MEPEYIINAMDKFDDLVEFTSFLIEKSYEDMEVSLEDVQDKAIALGILVESIDSDGNPRYFFADWFEEHRKEQPTPQDAS